MKTVIMLSILTLNSSKLHISIRKFIISINFLRVSLRLCLLLKTMADYYDYIMTCQKILDKENKNFCNNSQAYFLVNIMEMLRVPLGRLLSLIEYALEI